MGHHVALVRDVPDSLARCELTHIERTPIDLARARAQHRACELALVELGCRVERLPAAHDLPDSVFVEDTAVVLDEVAIVTRPGAPSRRGETAAVADALAGYRSVRHLTEPATLDGGDVLRLGRRLYVGVGGRSNLEGAAQLRAIAAPFGYTVREVEIDGCLHLKSAATEAAPGVVLVNPAWVDAAVFDGHRAIGIDPTEPGAANVLRLGEVVLSGAYPRTIERLRRSGVIVREVDLSELARAEGAVTCCSILLTQ